jgi:hypothetical protein
MEHNYRSRKEDKENPIRLLQSQEEFEFGKNAAYRFHVWALANKVVSKQEFDAVGLALRGWEIGYVIVEISTCISRGGEKSWSLRRRSIRAKAS